MNNVNATAAQELKDFLLETPGMVEFYRAHLMSPTVTRDKDTADRQPSTLHGRHSPLNLDALEGGDTEAAFVGELLRFAIDNGIIPNPRYLFSGDLDKYEPRLTMSAFWWSKASGRCLGLAGRTRAFQDMKVACVVLANHSQEILDVIGTDDEWMDSWRKFRSRGEIMVARQHSGTRDDDTWLTVDEACLYAERSRWTIMEWVKAGKLTTTDESVMSHRLILESSLRAALDEAYEARVSLADNARAHRWAEKMEREEKLSGGGIDIE